MIGIEKDIIPQDWGVKTLGDIANISSGGSAPQGEKYFNGENPFVRVQHVDQSSDSINKYDLITDEAIKKYKLKKYKSGTIVFPKSGASIYLEKRAVLPVDAYIVSHLCAVESTRDDIDQEFLFYILKQIPLSKDKADGYPTLNLSEIKRVAIPTPLFEEQRKIVFVLSKIKKAIEQQEQIIAKTKELKRSLMHRLFTYGLRGEELKNTEIGLLPESWKVIKLGEVATLQRGKDLPRYEFKNGNIPVIGSNGCIGYHNQKIMDGPGVVTGRSGSIGKVSYLAGSYWPHNTTLYVKDFHGNHPLFVFYMMYRLDFNKYKTGVSVPTLNRNFIHSEMVPVPDVQEQIDIAEILSRTDKKTEQAENHHRILSDLFKSMLNNLMTGQVRVKDIDFGEINV